METLMFAAALVYKPGQPLWRRPSKVPANVAPSAIVVRNPFTNKLLWIRPSHVINIVDNVAAVLISANYSGRLSPAKFGYREFINPLTGNTFQVKTSAIIKETT